MNTEISRYLVDENGNSFSSDTDLQGLSNNAKVKNTNSGVSYKKVPRTTSGVPVFDKVPLQKEPAEVTNNNSELLWGQTLTVGSVDGKALTVRMPANPDTKYSAGTGLGLRGTTFYIDKNWLKVFIKNNSGSGSGHEGYTIGGRYGDKWYVSDSSNGLNSSSMIYSSFEYHQAGCSGGPSVSLHGDHPPSGTYYCEIINTGIAGSSTISSCYIYTITYD